MIYNRLSGLVVGFAIGVILSVIVWTWGEASVIYRAIYVTLFGGLLFFATRSKPDADKGDDNSNNHPLNTLELESSHKSNDSTSDS